MEVVALIASIVSICLAFFAIWQANHHRDQSDKLNRDTTEKLARMETLTSSTKEDAFAELKETYGWLRKGGKALEEAEKAKEEELKNLKDEIQATTSAEINKVLQTVESRLSSSAQASTISEIQKEFEELQKEIGKIQEKGLGDVKRIEIKKKFDPLWFSLSLRERHFLAKALKHQTISKTDLVKADMITGSQFTYFVQWMRVNEVILYAMAIEPGVLYRIELTPEFREFLETVGKNEMD